MDSVKCFSLQLIFKNFKAIKMKVFFDITSLEIFNILFDFFGCDSKNPETFWSILSQHFMIIFWNSWCIHNLQHNFRWTFTIYEILSCKNTITSHYTHSLYIRIKLKSSINSSLMLSFTVITKYYIRVIVR